jgi:guanylate kinase
MRSISVILLFVNILCAEAPFLLISGPSGIGKSSVIKELRALDPKFVYIKPYTTRPLRMGEMDKVSIPIPEMMALKENGKLVALNFLYGNYYGTPLDPILDALDQGLFPVIDWPVEVV